MRLSVCFLFFLMLVISCSATRDPTLYEYYTSGGIKTGLKANHADHFILNGKPLIILGGTLHYFRHVPQYWPRILASYKAAGLNSVQLYVPWNRHEDTPGNLDFESEWLNLGKLLEEVKKADMFAVLRPGPFICAEWEFGGLPSWLLRDKNMVTRSNYGMYVERVKQYWTEMMKVVNKHQFVKGGPVLMVQIENEYSGYIPDYLSHIHLLLNLTRSTGYDQQIFTCDNMSTVSRLGNETTSIAELFEALNFGQGNYNENFFNRFKKSIQPNKPVYISEYWSGWFDYWSQKSHSITDAKELVRNAEKMILKFNISVNFYPMMGGTSFGFFNGAVDSTEQVTTSYDFNAPISEGHNFTEKYWLIRKLYLKLVQLGRLPKLALPDVPTISPPFAYGKVEMKDFVTLEQLLERCTKFVNMKKPVTMEFLEHGPGYGQRYGFVLYRAEGERVKSYEVTGPICDRGILLIDGNQVALSEKSQHFSQNIDPSLWSNTTSFHHIDMLVENLGRENQIKEAHERKGIDSDILLDGTPSLNLTIYSLDFNQTFMEQLGGLKWTSLGSRKAGNRPTLYRATLQIDDLPRDTFLLLDGWTKGSVFVNSFNVGRYWNVGPQKTLYIPAPLFKTGANTIEVFELHAPGRALQFIDRALWK